MKLSLFTKTVFLYFGFLLSIRQTAHSAEFCASMYNVDSFLIAEQEMVEQISAVEDFNDYVKVTKLLNEAQPDSLRANVIGPGIGPVDLDRIDRRIRFASIELKAMEQNPDSSASIVNNEKTAYWLERRAKLLKERAEFLAVAKRYALATESYNLAANDVVKSIQSGGLTKFEDQVAALRILGNAESNPVITKAIQHLSYKIAKSSQIQNVGVLDLSKLEFATPAANPVVANLQKSSLWESIRELRDQKIRIEILKAKTKDLPLSYWENLNTIETQEYNKMLARLNELAKTLDGKIKNEYGQSRPRDILIVLNQMELKN